MTSIKGRYARIEIPLDVAENDKELFLTGDYLSVVSITGEGTCVMKLDHRHSQKLDFREISGITGLFERLYLTTNGDGGICTLFVGTGIAITISADPEKLWAGGAISTQVTTTTDTVQDLANSPLKLDDVVIQNENALYACYIGPYNNVLATFKAHAYVLLPHKTIKFTKVDMYSLGVTSYDAINNVIIDILGRYQ